MSDLRTTYTFIYTPLLIGFPYLDVQSLYINRIISYRRGFDRDITTHGLGMAPTGPQLIAESRQYMVTAPQTGWTGQLP